MRFNSDFLDEIRARLPISSVVGQRVTFDKKKSNAARGDFWACCPFHGEKTPSFHCEDRKGRYHCFGCGVTGDQFRFLTDLEGLSFPEAVEQLAAQAGLQMPKIDPQTREREKAKATLYDVMEMAAGYFEDAFKRDAGRDARFYLEKRGLSDRTINKFRLGYAPDSRNGLKDYLVSKNISKAEMEATGLLVTGEDVAVPFDRFRDRVMFPIVDLRGRIVGFGGRALNDQAKAKYLNSPETDLFHKGRMLYNAANARRASQPQQGRPARPLIVVEGYMDVIALDQAGIDTAVAPLGTALTEEQIELLWRCSPDPILCFDGDEAGLKAAYRAIDRALPMLKSDVSMRFCLLPQGLDPDDLVRRDGKGAFLSLIEQAKPLSEMLWLREVAGKHFDTPEARAGLEKLLFQTVSMIKDETLKLYYQRDMRSRLKNFFQPLFNTGGKKGGYSKQTISTISDPSVQASLAGSNLVQKKGRVMPLREAAILVTLANHPHLWDETFDRLAELEFNHPALKALHLAMLDILAEWQPDDAKAMRQLLVSKGQGENLDKAVAIIKKAGMRSAYSEAPLEDAKAALHQALHLHLVAHNLNKRMREISDRLIESPDEQTFAALKAVKQELEMAENTQALIDGFGVWLEE